MGKPPQSPYPPDLAEGATPVADLTNLHGAEALRGVRMPWDDLLQNAPLFATAFGIEIID